MNIEEKIIQISTAWLIGLGYTPPPYNGSHSKEYITQLSQLFRETMLEMIDKASPLDEDHEYDPTDEMLIESYKHNLREAINNK